VHWVGAHAPTATCRPSTRGRTCFVYPSLFEGFGLPLVEAMACGCPVVSSNRTACPEVVGTCRLLVDPEDVKGIAEVIARLVDDEALRADLRNRGLARSRLFTWEESRAPDPRSAPGGRRRVTRDASQRALGAQFRRQYRIRLP
jgi:hypothetical protein